MVAYILSFCFAFLSVLILVPFIRKLAFRYNFIDIPNQRKVHSEPIPLLGGVAIFIGYLLSILLWIEPLRVRNAIILSGSLVVGIGLLDDYLKTRKKDLRAYPKLIVQIIVGLLLFGSGIRIEGISAFVREGMIFLTPGLSLLITLIWVIGLMNMMNFLDGADGLASGISIIASMTLFLISYVKGQEVTALLSIILMGASLGFLKYNFYPAKIFMGDAGSVFLGLMLAIISIEGALKTATLLSVLMVVLALGVPIFDTLIVLINRWRNHKPIHIADKTHAHHRLLQRGFTHKQAVTMIYLIGIILSIVSTMILFLN